MRSRMQIPRKHREGFTLVELLCVMTIVASVAAFLFPVIAASKKGAKRTVCLQNLKSIGVAVHLYQAEYDDKYPYGINEVSRERPGFRFGRPKDRSPDEYPTIVDTLEPLIAEVKILRCPMDVGRTFLDGPPATPTLFLHNAGSSYLFAELVSGETSSIWRDPAKQGYAADGIYTWHVSPGANWHTGKHNVLCYDGHAAFYPNTKVGVSFTP